MAHEWLRPYATNLTRLAAERVGGEAELWHLLLLDRVTTDAVAGLRSFTAKRAKDLTRSAALHDALAAWAGELVATLGPGDQEVGDAGRELETAADVAAAFRAALADAVATDPERWARRTRLAPPTMPSVPGDTVRAALAAQARFVEATARLIARDARVDAERAQQARPRHDDTGRRDFTASIRHKLTTLVCRLQWPPGQIRADARWSIRDVAELILASEHDWREPPCPGLVGEYRQRSQQHARTADRWASPREEWIVSNLNGAKEAKRREEREPGVGL